MLGETQSQIMLCATGGPSVKLLPATLGVVRGDWATALQHLEGTEEKIRW